MDTFIVAYSVVWLAVALYVYRLGARQRRLEEDLQRLRLQIEQSEIEDAPLSKAA